MTKTKTKLYARTTSGKTKFLELEVDGDYLITRWGYVDGKEQETKELCEAKNVGKANSTTAHQQAILEYERKIKKKTDEGYIETNNLPLAFGSNGFNVPLTKQSETPDFANLQKHFCPCKPIAKPPKDALTGKYLADRKFNGVNLILTKDKTGNCHLYTRRIEDITNNLLWIPEFRYNLNRIPKNSMLLIELIYISSISKKEEPEQLRGLINSRRTKEDVAKHRKNIIQNGEIFPIVFDVMFWNNEFMGNFSFLSRRKLLDRELVRDVASYMDFNKTEIKAAKCANWEGFILRESSGKLEYTMNGKAKRSGSWKYKFEETDDFIVRMAEKGKGKHDKYFARFNLIQYNKQGLVIDCGYCGPGTLKVEELEELYKERSDSNGDYKIMPFLIVEVLYRTRTKDGKLEFPVLQRIRDDKKPEECIYEPN
jgi:ATP-dependent DNA ligase